MNPSIGILGGTFNPIHIGHLRMAQELADSLQLSEVRFIPAANPPHKPAPQTGAEHRAAMVQLAIAHNPLFKLDNRELLRTGASYTFDTLQSLRNELGAKTSLVLFMGTDAFTKINTWHRWQELLDLCHIALVARPADAATQAAGLSATLESYLQQHYTESNADIRNTPAGLITMQHITPLAISSTAVRGLLQNQLSARYLVPDAVLHYIKTQSLYST